MIEVEHVMKLDIQATFLLTTLYFIKTAKMTDACM